MFDYSTLKQMEGMMWMVLTKVPMILYTLSTIFSV